jgi:hypothetical protein
MKVPRITQRNFSSDKTMNDKINNFLDKYYMRDKGNFFWKEKWYSICSAHPQYEKTCNTCNTGNWKNVWLGNIGSVIYLFLPKLWKWYMKDKNIELIKINQEEDVKKYYRGNKRKN